MAFIAKAHDELLQEQFAGQASWCKMPSALLEDGAPSAALGHLKARGSTAHPGAPPEHLGGLPWPQELASGCVARS